MNIEKIISATLLFFFLGALSSSGLQAQTKKRSNAVKTEKQQEKKQNKKQEIEIQVSVINEKGKPLSDVLITANEGRIQLYTDNNGNAKFLCPTTATATFENNGFETVNLPVSGLAGASKVTMISKPFQLTENDLNTVAFGEQYKRYNSASISTIKTKDFEKFDAQQNIGGGIESRLAGLLNSSDIRGMGAVVVVDGFVRNSSSFEDFTNNMNLQEIEEISVLKDPVSRILYGAYADKGIIMIKTKRGQANKRNIIVKAESSYGVPKRYPSYMNAADYMQYYNYALRSDGSLPLYTDEAITASRDGSNPLLYPNTNLYGNEFLNSFKPANRVITEFSGGDNTTQYYLNMGWNQSGSIIKNSDNNGNNRLNVRGNVDIKVNDFIKARFDGVAVYDINKDSYFAPKGFWAMAEQFKTNEFPYLIPIDQISPDDSLMVLAAKKVQGNNILGGSNLYLQNPVGDMYLGGYNKTTKGYIQVNIGFDFDLKTITKGLNFKTSFAYDNFTTYSTVQNNDYAVYRPYLLNGVMRIEKFGIDDFSGSQSLNNQNFYRRMGWSNVLNWKRGFGDHLFDVSAISFIDTYKMGEDVYTNKHANFGLKANYVYKGKYIADLAGSYVGTSRLQNRWSTSPSLGLAWIISEENFMKNLSSPISFLKFKMSGGIIKTDISDNWDSYYYYRDVFSESGSFGWADGRTNGLVQLSNVGNADLSWITRNEINAGIDLGLFNNDLVIEANYFRSDRNDDVSKLSNQYPSFLGGTTFIPYGNYNSESLKGFDASVTYSKAIGKFHLTSSFNVLSLKSVYTKFDEVQYEDGSKQLSKVGRPTDAIWGLQALGLYTQEQVDAINGTPENPTPTFGVVNAGDIRYADINGDGLVDNNDKNVIGNTRPRFTYNLNLNLKYQNFELFTYLRAQTSYYGNNVSNSYFGPVYANDKYPSLMTNSWIYLPELGIDTRETAILPRMSAKSNQNNTQNSTFWLIKKNYLTLPVVQLTYHLPRTIVTKIGMNSLGFYLRGTNLFTSSNNKMQNEMNVGSEPQYRWYALGLCAQF